MTIPHWSLDEGDVKAGRALFIQCAACHGGGLQATGQPGPDLRESGIALALDSFSQLLKNGDLLEQGMPRFETLTDQEISQLYAYIRGRRAGSVGFAQTKRRQVCAGQVVDDVPLSRVARQWARHGPDRTPG